MIRLLGRLKKEMNGAVAEAMQRRGLNYPLNYGVSVPTIRSIAGEYGTSHSLAMLLYRQQVRELKLAAAFVDDPQQVTPDQMRLWADGFANTELVEQVVYNLFRKAPGAERVALEWLDSPKPLLRYAGLLTAASTVRPEMEQTMRQAFFDRIDQLVFREIDSSAVLRGIVTALRQLACRCAEWWKTGSPFTERLRKVCRNRSPKNSGGSWNTSIRPGKLSEVDYFDILVFLFVECELIGRDSDVGRDLADSDFDGTRAVRVVIDTDGQSALRIE